MIAFTASMCICIYSIHEMWSKWRTNPIILSFDTKFQSIGSIPFPSVSICPLTKSSATKFNYTAVYRAMLKLDGNNSRGATPDEYKIEGFSYSTIHFLNFCVSESIHFRLKMMKVAVQFCEERIASRIVGKFVDDYADDSILSMIKDMAPKLKQTIVDCKMFNMWINCDKIFTPIVTEAGLCYTFNALDKREIVTNQ